MQGLGVFGYYFCPGQLSDCKCLPGRYRSAQGTSCLSCPYGSTTLEAGATSVTSCICLPDFVNMDAENPSACECGPGFGFDVQRGVCAPCPKGAYKEVAGSILCSSCPVDQSTVQEGSTSPQDCFCQPGLIIDGETCITCPAGSYCNGTNVAYACQQGANSLPGARTFDECICKPGHYMDSDGLSCRLCPRGRYKQSDGNDRICDMQCPTSADSGNGSASLSASRSNSAGVSVFVACGHGKE